MLYPIVGARFRPPAQAILAVLPSGTALSLVPEPDNEHDPNAVMVWLDAIPVQCYEPLNEELEGYGMTLDEVLADAPYHLGYIPRVAEPRPQARTEATLSFNPRGYPCALT